MLQELQKDGFDHIISWRPHGRAFMVVDQEAFAKEILPLWFRQSKYSSFQRQLNLYGFKRVGSGTDKGSHYHEHFLRGMPCLTSKIVRTKVKGTGTRKPRSAEDPDFYAMPASIVSTADSPDTTTMVPTKAAATTPVPEPASPSRHLAPHPSESMPVGSSIDQLLAIAMIQRQMEQNLLALQTQATLQRRVSTSSMATDNSERSTSPSVTSSTSSGSIAPLTTEQSLILAHYMRTNAV